MELKTAQEIEQFSQKNTYTPEEKKYIMEKLNSARLIEQKRGDEVSDYKKYTEKEKMDILKDLNDQRLDNQIYEEIKKRRTYKKKIYKQDVREFYKIVNMDRGYLIKVDDLKSLSGRPLILPLYYKMFGELKKKEFLMKIEIYSDKVFVSDDVLRVYFKGYSLENEW